MPPPSVKIDGLPSAFDQGQQTPFNMIFEGIDDSDQYGYRADVTNADNNDADDCEGTGLGGANQYTAELDGGEDGQVTLPGVIDASCPSITYTLTVTLMAAGGYSYTATQAFQVNGLSLSPIETDTPTPTATNTNTPQPTATATNPPRQQQPAATHTNTPAPTATNTHTPVPTATATVAPTPTPTVKVVYLPPQQKVDPTPTPMPTATAQPTPTATPTTMPTVTATATSVPTLMPTVTPTDDQTDELVDSIIPVVVDEETGTGADSGSSGWPGHYAAGRSVWSCQDLTALVNSLAALRQTMTAGDWPKAVTQPEIMNARLGPGLAYDVITTLPQGTRANIIGVDPRGEWYQLELSHIEIPVWISQSLATVEGSLDNVSQVSAEELALLPISGAPGSRPIASPSRRS